MRQPSSYGGDSQALGARRELAPSGLAPRMRGVLHECGFLASLAAGIALALTASGARAQVAAAIFAASVAAMFGASALFHRVPWSVRWRPWAQRLDHAMINVLIAGTYTPIGLLVLRGDWRVVVLAIVWSGAACAIFLKLVWVGAPGWLAAVIGVALGWVGVVAFPQLLARLGAAGAILLLAGGIFYTAGAIVYALRRPDPAPAVFGYHEVFHALVVAAVVCHYISIAFFVLPLAA